VRGHHGGRYHVGPQRPVRPVRLVLRLYTDNPVFSVQRYRLTKEVPGLRAYELSVVWRYERTFAGHLRERLADRPDGALRADVIAAAVVAAHNNVLRSWLRSGGEGDAGAAADRALAYVREAFGDGAGRGDEQDEDVVVVVSRRGAPMWRVVREIESALGPGERFPDRP
jgi:hypothetical protein